jgi:hypothetical protein
MLSDISDMAAFAISHPLKIKQALNVTILTEPLLFYKLGMNSFIIETDMSDAFVGSSYSWGTARDWARFGLLYLNNGLYNNDLSARRLPNVPVDMFFFKRLWWRSCIYCSIQ